ncbi:hypothetical protein [Jannaschia seohaensis]|uniref:Uncharacterized protein n=1 Tax=Jannaschia seohaensis TaxID=475081 RepID=A0A2Y9B4K2_9RHOB|nr:hypothetical protein [Jannaschia seohaensis]PWJ11464.1 hypothetical protein BCF38_11931 [Jannaschia seohaensis]SSA51444.1 hypothetical protein SAMN05421539_11931 [Jannaschia seohaensis]
MPKDPFKSTPFWRPAEEERASLRSHLLAELPPGHVLFTHRETLEVHARDKNALRLVITCKDPAAAIVHMTWTGRPPMAPFLPETEIYPSLDGLISALIEKGAE